MNQATGAGKKRYAAAHTPGPRSCRALDNPLLVDPLTGSSPFTLETEPDDRILYLSGTWRLPGRQSFQLRAAIGVLKGGGAEGAIDWHRDQTPYYLVGRELVTGSVGMREVLLSGYKAEPGLATDRYQITLVGGRDEGVFRGKSRAFGQWDGCMEGAYWFASRRRTP